VCRGTVSLAVAQHQIATDWLAVYRIRRAVAGALGVAVKNVVRAVVPQNNFAAIVVERDAIRPVDVCLEYSREPLDGMRT